MMVDRAPSSATAPVALTASTAVRALPPSALHRPRPHRTMAPHRWDTIMAAPPPADTQGAQAMASAHLAAHHPFPTAHPRPPRHLDRHHPMAQPVQTHATSPATAAATMVDRAPSSAAALVAPTASTAACALSPSARARHRRLTHTAARTRTGRACQGSPLVLALMEGRACQGSRLVLALMGLARAPSQPAWASSSLHSRRCHHRLLHHRRSRPRRLRRTHRLPVVAGHACTIATAIVTTVDPAPSLSRAA